MAQTAAYGINPGRAVAGMIADGCPATIITVIAAEALRPGLHVVGDTDGNAVLPDDDSGTILGVVVYDPAMESTYPQGTAVYAAGSVVPVLRRGRIWALHDNDANPTRLTACKLSNAADAEDGFISAAAVATDAYRDLTGAAMFVEDTAQADTIALIEVDYFAGMPAVGPEGPEGPEGPPGE